MAAEKPQSLAEEDIRSIVRAFTQSLLNLENSFTVELSGEEACRMAQQELSSVGISSTYSSSSYMNQWAYYVKWELKVTHFEQQHLDQISLFPSSSVVQPEIQSYLPNVLASLSTAYYGESMPLLAALKDAYQKASEKMREEAEKVRKGVEEVLEKIKATAMEEGNEAAYLFIDPPSPWSSYPKEVLIKVGERLDAFGLDHDMKTLLSQLRLGISGKKLLISYKEWDWPEWSAFRVEPDPIPESEVSKVSASSLALAEVEAAPPHASASPRGFRDFSVALRNTQAAPAAADLVHDAKEDDNRAIQQEDALKRSAFKVVPDPIPESEVSKVSASSLALAEVEAAPPHASASTRGFRDFSAALTGTQAAPAAADLVHDAKEDDNRAIQEEDALNQTITKLRNTFNLLKEKIAGAVVLMQANSLYKPSSNKLKVVKMLDDALKEYIALPDREILEDNLEILRSYQELLIRSIALASIIISYDTKGSRMAQFGNFFTTPKKATEIEPFMTWVKSLDKDLALSVDTIAEDVKKTLAASIKEAGVLDMQKPFKSLLERIDARTTRGKEEGEGKVVLFELMRFSSNVEQNLSARGLS